MTLLETVLRETESSAIFRVQLAASSTAPLTLARDIVLIDLRDQQLARLAIDRNQLVSSGTQHYPCTRAWATTMQGRSIHGRPVDGCVWYSRQADLFAARHRGGLADDLLRLSNVEVSVLWQPPGTTGLLVRDGRAESLVTASGEGTRLVTELANLLQLAIL